MNKYFVAAPEQLKAARNWLFVMNNFIIVKSSDSLWCDILPQCTFQQEQRMGQRDRHAKAN